MRRTNQASAGTLPSLTGFPEGSRAACRFTIVQISAQQIAEPSCSRDPMPTVPRRADCRRREGSWCDGHRPRPADRLAGTVLCRPKSSTASSSEHRNGDPDRSVNATAIAPVPGVDEIKTLRKRSTSPPSRPVALQSRPKDLTRGRRCEGSPPSSSNAAHACAEPSDMGGVTLPTADDANGQHRTV